MFPSQGDGISFLIHLLRLSSFAMLILLLSHTRSSLARPFRKIWYNHILRRICCCFLSPRNEPSKPFNWISVKLGKSNQANHQAIKMGALIYTLISIGGRRQSRIRYTYCRCRSHTCWAIGDHECKRCVRVCWLISGCKSQRGTNGPKGAASEDPVQVKAEGESSGRR